jgi:FAD:protein FMN transferase
MKTVFTDVEKLMGNRFAFSVVANSQAEADQYFLAAKKEVKRIEAVFTTFSEHSLTNQINAAAGKHPVEVTEEFFNLTERAQRISALTDGAFDLSYGSLDKSFWNFDKTMLRLPEPKDMKAAVGLIDYRNIVLDNTQKTVFLKKEGMRIGFGGIGKGYAADQAKRVLVEMGLDAGVINASGDLTTWGSMPNYQPWTIALAHPDSPLKAFSNLNISNLAVATSGNYEKYVSIGGKSYSHTINPKTGYPVHGIKSVSVICPMAELADALATPITILGVDAGLALINQIHGVHCVIIDEQNTLYHSKNINLT